MIRSVRLRSLRPVSQTAFSGLGLFMELVRTMRSLPDLVMKTSPRGSLTMFFILTCFILPRGPTKTRKPR